MNARLQIRRRPARSGRRGQTLIFLLMLMLIMIFAALLVFDVHKTIFVKTRAQNAGDAAALAGARWQGIALNLIGELNVLEAIAVTDALARRETVFPEADAIADLAARINFVGPMTGLSAAQDAAKQNHAFVSAAATSWLTSYGQSVQRDYPGWFPPPFGSASDPIGAWTEYSEMIQAVAANGVAAAPSVPFYGYINEIPGNHHLLLDPRFYTAVLNRNWCWFYFNAMSTLQSYHDWSDWPALPLRREAPINSEFLSLGLERVQQWDRIPGLNASDVPDLLREMEQSAHRGLDSDIADVSVSWMAYSTTHWGLWSAQLSEDFPFESAIRTEYDVTGADAVLTVEETVTRTTPGVDQPTVTWTAAAKPFGHLDPSDPIHRFGLVLPGFTDVRLIPVSASSDPNSGLNGLNGQIAWATHIHDHLPAYLATGPTALNGGCSYCRALTDRPTESGWWENAEFRASGLSWLSTNSQNCATQGSGGGPGGGAQIGH